MKESDTSTVDPNILLWKLQAGGYLIQDEFDEIKSTPMTIAKFVVSMLLI